MREVDSQLFIRDRRKLFLTLNMLVIISFSASLVKYTIPSTPSFSINAIIAMLGVYYIAASIYSDLYDNKPITVFVTVLCFNIIGVIIRALIELGHYTYSNTFTFSNMITYLLTNSILITCFYLFMQFRQKKVATK